MMVSFVLSLLTGCATTMPQVPGVDKPEYIKSEAYYKTNLKDVITKAEAGEVASQVELVFFYTDDVTKSNYWLEKAASQNYLPAVSALCARHYDYSRWQYAKNDSLSEQLCYRAYEIFLSKPENEWNNYERTRAAGALTNIAIHNLKNKDLAQDLLCKAKKIPFESPNSTYMINTNLKQIGRTCSIQ